MMTLKKIKEGKIKLFVQEGRIYDASVFYNPVMEFNRNISVAALQVFQNNFGKLEVCDATAGTGVRGLRYAKEVAKTTAVLNDKNPVAVKLIRKNIKENKLERKCTAKKSDANILMRQKNFAAIDIDPFGSPNIFLDSAAYSIHRKGFLMITATDTAPLCGVYPEKCFKKYGIKSIKTDFYNELGIRILISSIIMSLAKYDKSFIPVLSFSHKHYFRVIGKIGKQKNNLGFVMFCECGNRETGELKTKCLCGKKFDFAYPVYLEKIQDKKFIAETIKESERRGFKNEEKFLRLIKSESELPAFYYDIHFLCRILKKECPKFDDLIKLLKSNGFKAGRTHFCRTGIKTNANFEEIKKIMGNNS